MDEITYSINEVAERLDVTYRSLHYWEDKLNLQINRDGAGNRRYTESDIEILEKIKELKLKGMALDGIKALFAEKGILQQPENANLIIVDEKSLEMKEYILDEIREVIKSEIKETNEKLDQVLKENQDLREELRKMQRESADHYSKIDVQLQAWRDKQQPWYKKILK